jgi:GAF domain-containing protein
MSVVKSEVRSAYQDSRLVPAADLQEPLLRVDYDRGREDIANLIATEPDYRVLFDRMMEVVKGFVDFDWAYLFIFTPGREYSRIVCRYGPEIPFQSRWFETGEGYRNWIIGAETWIDDFKTFIANGPHPEMLERPDYQRVIAAGVKALVCLPVQERGKVIGGICVQSKEKGKYKEEDRRTLERLMLGQALPPVFHAVEGEGDDFVSGLVTKIATSKDFQELARIVVEEIARFYEFQNVSIFKVNALRGHFRLLAQALGPEAEYCGS